MTKKILALFATLILTSLTATSASAMKVSLETSATISHDILFSYSLYDVRSGHTRIKHESLSVDIPSDKLAAFMSAMNQSLAYIVPIEDYQGKKSVITLGYIKKDGTSVSPATCRNIPATMDMNLYLDETGCVVR